MLSILLPLLLLSGAASAPAPVEGVTGGPAPTANLTGLIRVDDYPLEAIQKEEEGTVQVAINVDQRGAVADCVVEKSSGSAALDSQTCRLMWLRARFAPARDAAGKPVKGVFHQRITWRLEGGLPTSAWATRLIILFGPDGEFKSCRLENEGALAAEKPGECPAEAPALALMAKLLGVPTASTSMIFEERFVPGAAQAQALEAPSSDTPMWRVAMEVDIDQHGKVSACREIARDGPLEAPPEPCKNAVRSFDPPVGKSGKREPLKGLVTISGVLRRLAVT